MGQDALLPLGLVIVDSAEAAERVRAELLAGADFDAVARRASIDSTSRVGGNLGRVALSALRSELAVSVQGLGPGKLGPVVRIPNGFAILKVLPPGAPPPAESLPLPLSIAAAGSVRFVASVDGLNAANLALGQVAKPPGWDQDLAAICDGRRRSYSAAIRAVEGLLASGRIVDPVQMAQTRQLLGELHAYGGDMARAVEGYEAALAIATEQLPQALPLLEEMTGVAYLHKAEMDNGVYRTPGDRCLFPMRSDLRYANPADAQKAVAHLTKAAEGDPENLEMRWLLNLAYRAAGGYPDAVPKAHRLEPALFESEAKVGRFADVAVAAGIDFFAMAGGVIVDDFDNDDRLDVALSTFDMCRNLHVFHGQADGRFAEKPGERGLADQLGGLNMMQTDYDNDGCRDILVVRGGWEIPQRKSLLRGHCDGSFTDVTAQVGLAEPATATQTAAWADVDDDGRLDLFVGNEDRPAQLFLNRADGHFEDVSVRAGIARPAFVKGVTAGDYDQDGRVDFFVSNYGGENLLYHNDGDARFSEVGARAGVSAATKAFSSWFFDYDNDGWLDIFVTSFFGSVEETARTYAKQPHNAATLKLYRNRHDGTFEDVTEKAGLARVFMPMGAGFGDVDADGYPDIYLATGNPSYASLVPNVMLLNREGRTFADVTAASGTGELHKGHGVAFADVDGDGDQDLLAETGGATPGDAHAFRLFENPGNGNDWLSVRLVGEKTARAAYGARIQVTVESAGKRRSIYRTVGSGGSFGASPLEQFLGLGPSAKIVSVEVWWPMSGVRQRFDGVAKNQAIEIRELGQAYRKLERRSARLGGEARAAR